MVEGVCPQVRWTYIHGIHGIYHRVFYSFYTHSWLAEHTYRKYSLIRRSAYKTTTPIWPLFSGILRRPAYKTTPRFTTANSGFLHHNIQFSLHKMPKSAFTGNYNAFTRWKRYTKASYSWKPNTISCDHIKSRAARSYMWTRLCMSRKFFTPPLYLAYKTTPQLYP